MWTRRCGASQAALRILKTNDNVKYIATDDSWLMFRTSGTEPIIRIYCEASSAAKVKKLLALGRGTALEIAGGR